MKYVFILFSLLTFSSCEEDVPNDPFAVSDKTRDSIYLKVQELYVGTKYSEAEKLLNTIRARDIYDHGYYFHTARVKFSLAKYSDAIHSINAALKVSRNIKNIAAMYYMKSECYGALNLLDSAVTSLNEAVQLDSNNVGYIIARSRLYGLMNLPILRYDDIMRLIRIDSNKVDYQVALNELKFNFGDTVGALASMDILAKKYPENAFVLYKRGQLSFAIGKKKDAKYYFQKCMDIDPTNAAVFFYMASILSDEKKNDKACDCLLKAVELGDKDAMNHIFKCDDYLKKKGIQIQIKKDTLNHTTTVQQTTEV